MEIRASLEQLVRLQQLDSLLTALRRELAAGPAELAERDASLSAARANLERAKAAQQETTKARRSLESDVEGIRQRIARHQQQMMSVKTNQEYRALSSEIEHERKAIDAQEDQILLLMERAEIQAKAVLSCDQELAAEGQRVQRERAEIEIRLRRVEGERNDAESQRRQLVSQIAAENLALYDRIAKMRPTVIAEVVQELCGGCRVRCRPQAIQEARLFTRLVQCESCGRLLHVRPTAAEAGADADA